MNDAYTGPRIPGDAPSSRRLVFDPKSLMLATMFVSTWFGWTWAVYDAWALRSDKRHELAQLVAIGLLGSAAFACLVLLMLSLQVMGLTEARYALILLSAWKLAISYKLSTALQPDFEVFAYFGGEPSDAWRVFVGGSLLNGLIMSQLPFGFWWLVLR